jgi:ribose/xylose/arabinose/galactoside ABC-type transport system permease subunit
MWLVLAFSTNSFANLLNINASRLRIITGVLIIVIVSFERPASQRMLNRPGKVWLS